MSGQARQVADQLLRELSGARPRRALARAITLVESTRDEDREVARRLLEGIEESSTEPNSFRLGISGTPGVGKSTFVEAFGLELLGRGHRVAVLAIDPTSSLSGGSILGDKTRMEELSRHPEAYVRPSPNAGHLGGVGAASRAAVLLCEAAGYDYIIVETVGVGQAEWRVHGMTDAFLLLAQPAAGDELQGIKRGILELADHLVVNKADLMPDAAKRTAAELRRSLHLAPPRPDGWTVKVATCSALKGEGIAATADRLRELREHLVDRGLLAGRRHRQRSLWLRETLDYELLRRLHRYLADRDGLSDGWPQWVDQTLSIPTAADVILADFLSKQN